MPPRPVAAKKAAAAQAPAAKSSAKKAASARTPAAKAAAPGKTGAKRPAPAAAPAKAKAPQPVVTLKTLSEQLAETHDLPRKQAATLAADLMSAITAQLKAGAKLRLAGLGTLEVKHRAARRGRNPATGATIQIKASKKIAFRPAKELKEAI